MTIPQVSRRAFSLIEVLLAIFILGIGAISIAAIFPAGIVQQRQSVDDMLGPIVANNALEIIRAKVRPDDFGFIVNASGDPIDPDIPTIPGDWRWRRPGFVIPGGLGASPDSGSIAIFGGGGAIPSEIPYNAIKYPSGTPPQIFIRQGERYYPQAFSTANPDVAPKPEYVWDCMFRRFEGRIYVAIFVYRVAAPNMGSFTYRVPGNPTNVSVPPLPIWLRLESPARQWDCYGSDNKRGTPDDVVVPGTAPGSTFDPTDHTFQWQMPGQWILDQNNNIHRVQLGRTLPDDPSGPVTLMRPVPEVPDLPVYSAGTASMPNLAGKENVVTDIWYLPTSVTVQIGGQPVQVEITPVYIMVREL